MTFEVKTNKQITEIFQQIQDLSNDFIPENMGLKERRKLYNPWKIFHVDFSYKDGIHINYVSHTKLNDNRLIPTIFDYYLRFEQCDDFLIIDANLIINAFFIWKLTYVILVILSSFYFRDFISISFAILFSFDLINRLVWEHIHLKQDLTAIINDDYDELYLFWYKSQRQ